MLACNLNADAGVRVEPYHPYVHPIRPEQVIGWGADHDDSWVDLPHCEGPCRVIDGHLILDVFALKEGVRRRRGKGLADMRLLKASWKGEIHASGVNEDAPGPMGFWMRCLMEHLIDCIVTHNCREIRREHLLDYYKHIQKPRETTP